MPPDRDPVYLWDMVNAARGVVRAVEGLTYEQYSDDENLKLSVERRIEILGEAARISPELRAAHPEIPWRPIVDQRNVLVHAYGEIADERIWQLTQHDIPRLLEQLEVLLPPLEDEPET